MFEKDKLTGVGQKPKLLPCPFCGGEAVIEERPFYDSKKYQIVCGNKRCSIAPETRQGWVLDLLVEDWNRRAGHE